MLSIGKCEGIESRVQGLGIRENPMRPIQWEGSLLEPINLGCISFGAHCVTPLSTLSRFRAQASGCMEEASHQTSKLLNCWCIGCIGYI